MKKKAWIVFHTYDNGHQIEVFVGKHAHQKASRCAAVIALDYLGNRKNDDDAAALYQDAKRALDSGAYGEVLDLVSVPDQDNRCNVEVFETEVH
jgi:hypothetical protein